MAWPLMFLALAAPDLHRTGGPSVELTPASSVSARATARIRVISGVRFGPGREAAVQGSIRRKGVVRAPDGSPLPAELLEFQ